MSLTLLTSSVHPDPWADEGRHETTYALYPHAGTWRTGTLRQAEALNAPLQAVPMDSASTSSVASTPASTGTALPPTARLLGVDTPAVALAALKASEDGDDVMLRVYEAHGTRGETRLQGFFDPSSIVPADILERPLEAESSRPPALAYRPFQVRTFRLRWDTDEE